MMSNAEQILNWLDKPLGRVLAVVAVVALLIGIIKFFWTYNDQVNRQLPAMKEQVKTLSIELRDERKELSELKKSIDDTDVLLKAISLIPGEIIQISRNLFISYDEDHPSLIALMINGQKFQWNISVNKEEDGSYSGMVGHKLFGSSLTAGDENKDKDEKTKKLISKGLSAIDKMGLFINAANRIDLSSRIPQQIASDKSLSSMHPAPENGLEIYIVIERNEDQNRRWRCALIATTR